MFLLKNHKIHKICLFFHIPDIRPFDELFQISNQIGVVKAMVDLRNEISEIELKRKLETQLELRNAVQSEKEEEEFEEPENLKDPTENEQPEKEETEEDQEEENVMEKVKYLPKLPIHHFIFSIHFLILKSLWINIKVRKRTQSTTNKKKIVLKAINTSLAHKS